MGVLLKEEKKLIIDTHGQVVPTEVEKKVVLEAPYGYCPTCKASLDYNPDTDEVYCPICGVVYDSFVVPYAEVKYAKPEPEEEDIQVHKKLKPQDIYSIESDIRKRHLDEATTVIKKGARAIGFSEDSPVVKSAVDIFARYLKHQKTRSDSLEVSAYAALLLAARANGYAITEENLLHSMGRYGTERIRKLAKQIRAKRRFMASLLKINTTAHILGEENQPVKLLEIYRHKLSKVKILQSYEGAIIQKVYELWKKAKSDLLKLNKTAKSIATALTYVAAILVLPDTHRVRLRQFDISDIFQTTPITIREVLPVIMKYLTPEEQRLVKSCMRRGRRSLKA